jgi:DHA2 family multidrug resistance protein
MLCLLLTLVFVENHPLKRKVPLYQVDHAGLILLTSSMLLLNYAIVYGKVEDWLESDKIKGAFFGSAVTFLLFIKRELRIRRPFFDLTLFTKQNFRVGLLFFLLLGIFIPGTFQSAFTGSVLHYNMTRNMELSLYLVPGILVGCIVCFIWYYKKYDDQILIITGFLAFVIYHILMYTNFSTDFDIDLFWLPCVIKGFGTALLYISVGLYTTKKLGIPAVLSAAGAMILVRSFLGSGVASSLYGYILYSERIKRFEYLVGLIDTNNFLSKEHGNNLALYKNLQEQATLTASKEVTGYIIIAGLVLLAILLANYFCQKARVKFAVNKKDKSIKYLQSNYK